MAEKQSCLICDSADVKTESLILPKSGQTLTLTVCQKCGHGRRIDDRGFHGNLAVQEEFFNATAKIPARHVLRWPHRPALIASEVKRLVGSGGKALDIGCGTGMWLAALGCGWTKHGVELSPKAATIARNFAEAEIFCGPIESFVVKPCSFDLVTAFAVIEHVEDPRFLVSWAFEHLRPGGLLVLMTGDRESRTATEMAENWPLYRPTEHVSFFSARSLGQLVEDTGFSIARKEWRFMYMPWGMGSRTFRFVEKLKEIMALVKTPKHDHLYLYALKPATLPTKDQRKAKTTR